MDPFSTSKKPHTGAIVAVVVLAAVLGGVWYLYGGKIPRLSPNSQSTKPIDIMAGEGKTLAQQSQLATIVRIEGCTPSPKIIRTNHTTAITFKNSDKQAHVISFSPTMKFTVPSAGRFTKTFSEWTTAGVRYYSCDKVKSAGGIYIYQ